VRRIDRGRAYVTHDMTHDVTGTHVLAQAMRNKALDLRSV